MMKAWLTDCTENILEWFLGLTAFSWHGSNFRARWVCLLLYHGTLYSTNMYKTEIWWIWKFTTHGSCKIIFDTWLRNCVANKYGLYLYSPSFEPPTLNGSSPETRASGKLSISTNLNNLNRFSDGIQFIFVKKTETVEEWAKAVRLVFFLYSKLFQEIDFA